MTIVHTEHRTKVEHQRPCTFVCLRMFREKNKSCLHVCRGVRKKPLQSDMLQATSPHRRPKVPPEIAMRSIWRQSTAAALDASHPQKTDCQKQVWLASARANGTAQPQSTCIGAHGPQHILECSRSSTQAQQKAVAHGDHRAHPWRTNPSVNTPVFLKSSRQTAWPPPDMFVSKYPILISSLVCHCRRTLQQPSLLWRQRRPKVMYHQEQRLSVCAVLRSNHVDTSPPGAVATAPSVRDMQSNPDKPKYSQQTHSLTTTFWL